MAIHRKRFRVEEAIVGEMPSPEMIEEAAPMHSEIMAELRAIRAQMAKGAAPLSGSAATLPKNFSRYAWASSAPSSTASPR